MNLLSATSIHHTRLLACVRWMTVCALLLWQMGAMAFAAHAQPVDVTMATAENSVACEHCLPSGSASETALSACSLSCATASCCAQPIALPQILRWHASGQPSYISYQLRLASAELPPSTPPPK